ncbi:ATP-binding protein [Streptomyces roseirectus]|uniref:ATP-binding protein n=1 Tax=Streptomyces roseirectus TaxID=2768066 RepID=A0A7H0I9T2_9ACTN|nr:AAA family ATPase [Streptomyces roseirectus]QNP69548.1 ATP-binding protein [Streptomyces roseirectus]
MRAYFVIGPAGSGKSTVARLLARLTGAAHLDKDTACTRLTEALLAAAGTDPGDRDGNAYYLSAVRELEYLTLLDLARDNLAVGRDVVLDAPFGSYFADAGFLTAAPRRHGWPTGVEPVVVHVRVDSATARERVRARGLARDASKLADWAAFWSRTEANPCRWEGARRLAFDNTPEGVSEETVRRALATLG